MGQFVMISRLVWQGTDGRGATTLTSGARTLRKHLDIVDATFEQNPMERSFRRMAPGSIKLMISSSARGACLAYRLRSL